MLLEIADQANANAVRVEIVAPAPDAEVAPARTLAMGTGDLPFPARAGVDAAVRRVHAVADHKVIAEAVGPPALVPVVVVDAGRRVVVVGGVMDHDHVPAAALDAAGRNQRALVELCRGRPAGDSRRGSPGQRGRLDSRRCGVPSFEQGIRQRPGRDFCWLGASTQRRNEHASAQRNPLHQHAPSLAEPTAATDCLLTISFAAIASSLDPSPARPRAVTIEPA